VLVGTQESYLDALNPEQRRAVEHGVGSDGIVGSPRSPPEGKVRHPFFKGIREDDL
jgi:hypothetical protein